MTRRRVLFVSMHYRPEPCDTRTSVLARAFVRRGHESTVLTSFPNYPFGKVYDGHKQTLCQKSDDEGVELVRVPMFPDHSKSIARRALSYLSFGFSASLLGLAFTRRPDIVWIHHPPLTTGIAGWWIAKVKRVPFVYEIHDLWPETLVSAGMSSEGRATRAIKKVCKFLYERASAIVVTSEGMKSHLAAQGVEESKMFVVPQWADEEALSCVARDDAFGVEQGLAGKFNIVFTGNVGAAQGLDSVIEAAEKLRDEATVQFVIVGAGVELDLLKEHALEKGLANVKFVGHVAKEEVPQYLAWADGLLMTLRRDPLFEITVPSKTQVYLQAGKPVLCGVAGDAARIIERSRSGITFEPEDSEALASAVRRLYATPPLERNAMGERGRSCYEANFSVSRLIEVYHELFESVLDPMVTTVETPVADMSNAA